MASKNICSEGYIKFPLFSSLPVSRSLFAGRAGCCDGIGSEVARGMVEISRCVPSRNEDSIEGLEDVDWSSCEESQDVWRGASGFAGVGGGATLGGCGFGGWFWVRACLSHASLALWSTGHAAAGSSETAIVKNWDG